MDATQVRTSELSMPVSYSNSEMRTRRLDAVVSKVDPALQYDGGEKAMDLRRLSLPLSPQLKIKCPARCPSSLSLDVRERGLGPSIEAWEF